jgi:hypothetical protein
MRKRILSGVLLACIIVPTFFWAFDLIKVSVNPNSIAATIHDSSYLTYKSIVDRAAAHLRTDIEGEHAQISKDIENIEKLMTESSAGQPVDKTRMAAWRDELEKLLARRKAILEARSEQLFVMDQQRLEAERYFIVKLRANAAKEEWNSLYRIVEIEGSIAKRTDRNDHEHAASVVNEFIDAVISLDLNQAKKLASKTLRDELGLSRVRAMRRNAPSELEKGFELREAGAQRIEVWAGEKIAVLCSQDGTWVLEDAWK